MQMWKAERWGLRLSKKEVYHISADPKTVAYLSEPTGIPFLWEYPHTKSAAGFTDLLIPLLYIMVLLSFPNSNLIN